jgi:hypothetical protein
LRAARWAGIETANRQYVNTKNDKPYDRYARLARILVPSAIAIGAGVWAHIALTPAPRGSDSTVTTSAVSLTGATVMLDAATIELTSADLPPADAAAFERGPPKSSAVDDGAPRGEKPARRLAAHAARVLPIPPILLPPPDAMVPHDVPGWVCARRALQQGTYGSSVVECHPSPWTARRAATDPMHE